MVLPDIPQDTVLAVRVADAQGDIYVRIGDQANALLDGLEVDLLDPNHLKPGLFLSRMALITVFQYLESLVDGQAIEAVRSRPDWKYALHLPIGYPGFYPSALREFRECVLIDFKSQAVFSQILERLSQADLLDLRKLGHDPHLQMLQIVSGLSYLQQLSDQLSQAIEALAACQPEFLLNVARPHWYSRYKGMTVNGLVPCDQQEMRSMMRSIQEDAHYLLEKVESEHNPVLDSLPEVTVLRRAWSE